jgi:dolichyl-phosphate-mannose-protein mannosyltransferase
MAEGVAAEASGRDVCYDAPMFFRSKAEGLAVGVLCVAFFLEGLFASRVKSPSNDESVHIMAGRSYIATGKIIANPQHPPLVKELAGISLALAGIQWNDPAQASMERLPAGWEWAAGIKFVAESGVSRTLFWARLPILVLSSLMGVLIYLGGRELAGPIAGFAALFLFAADPTMLAHSYLVTTDAGVTVFTLLFLLALLKFLRKPSLFRLAAAGVALGLALSSKFSAIFLLPIAGALLVANWLWPLEIREEPGRPPLVFLLSDMAFLCLAAILVIQICYFSWRGPVLYLHGLGRVNADHTASFRAYLDGQLKERFISYFAIAWLLKEPLATIALAAGGAIAALRSRTIPCLHKLFLLLPPLVFFVACSVWADDLGVRYEMPAMVFGYLAGGTALAALWKRRTIWRVVAAGSCLWVAAAAAGIYPDHLSYFNEAACLPVHLDRIGLDGGSRCGADWLADSNVDWGQSLPQLKSWLDRNAPGRTVRLEYFGTFPPAAYGIPFEPADPYMVPIPPPGIYVISSHWLSYASLLTGAKWLRGEPEAIVGHAYYIFEF